MLNLVIPDFESLAPEKQENILSTVGFLVRKLAHFSEYALLGFSLMLHITRVQKKITVRLPWLWAWGIGTLYAATDEFHQGFVAGRGPSVVDVTIDSAGVIAGLLLMIWILKKRTKINEREYYIC